MIEEMQRSLRRTLPFQRRGRDDRASPQFRKIRGRLAKNQIDSKPTIRVNRRRTGMKTNITNFPGTMLRASA